MEQGTLRLRTNLLAAGPFANCGATSAPIIHPVSGACGQRVGLFLMG